jgi:hypothetical protein
MPQDPVHVVGDPGIDCRNGVTTDVGSKGHYTQQKHGRILEEAKKPTFLLCIQCGTNSF